MPVAGLHSIVLALILLPTAGAMPKYFTFYGNDAPNQHTWSNLGTAGLPDIIGTPTLAHPPPRRLCLRALVC
eukprot:COSAG06_NODE_4276_length_4411_cov_1.926716_1_plen_72_part_00